MFSFQHPDQQIHVIRQYVIAWFSTILSLFLLFMAYFIHEESSVVSFCLFDLMLYFHGKQLRSCWDGQVLNHTVTWQASLRQIAILSPVTDN